jgi:hypothetical protein
MLTRGDRDWIRRIVREETEMVFEGQARLAENRYAQFFGVPPKSTLEPAPVYPEEHPYAWVGEYASELAKGAVEAFRDVFRLIKTGTVVP